MANPIGAEVMAELNTIDINSSNPLNSLNYKNATENNSAHPHNKLIASGYENAWNLVRASEFNEMKCLLGLKRLTRREI